MYLQLLSVPLIAVGTWITWRARNREDYRTVAIYQIHRFKRPFPTIYGPLLYPTGQLLIALSPSYFPA